MTVNLSTERNSSVVYEVCVNGMVMLSSSFSFSCLKETQEVICGTTSLRH